MGASKGRQHFHIFSFTNENWPPASEPVVGHGEDMLTRAENRIHGIPPFLFNEDGCRIRGTMQLVHFVAGEVIGEVSDQRNRISYRREAEESDEDEFLGFECFRN